MKWGLEKKIQAGFGSALLILVIVGGLSYRNMFRLIGAGHWVAHTHEVLAELEATLNAMDVAESGQRGYLITGDEHYLADYGAGSAGVYAHVQQVKDLTQDNPDQQRRIVHLKPLIDERLATLQHVIDRRRGQGFEAAKEIVLSGRGRQQMGEIRKLITEMERQEDALLTRRVREDEASVRNTSWTIGIFILLAFALLGASIYMINGDFAGRSRAEVTLREQASLLDLAHDTIMVSKLDGTITFWNRGAEEMYGWTREEALGKNSHTLLQTQFPKLLREIESDLFREGRWEGELIHVGRDGRRVVAASRWALRKDQRGSLTSILEINNDITAQKQAEEALIRDAKELALSVENLGKQTELFQSILSSMGDGVIVADERGKFLNWNPAAEQILGLGAMDVPIDKLTEKYGFYLPDKKTPYPAFQVPLARAVRGEVANKEEMFVRNDLRPAGVWVSATGTPLRDQAGVMRGGVVVLSEITERKQAEEALIRDAKELAVSVESLRKQTELFQSILRSMGDGVIVADGNGKFLNWNPAADEILGLGAMDVPIDKLTEKYGFYLPDKVTPCPASQVPLARAVRGEVANKEEMFVRNDLRPAGVWVSATATPLKDAKGVMRGGVVVLSDITERKQAEEGIRRLNEDLERRTVALEATNKELEAFTYSVSHDLRAPLRHIDGFSKLLVEQHAAALPEEAREYVSLIRESTREMGRLVDDLLNLARVGRQELSVQVTGLNSVVDDVVAELKLVVTERTIDWKVQKLPFVECDPGLMKQVFVNLLSNAVKFTRPREQAVIEVGTINRDGQSAIFVCDNGVGFSMKHADKLFGVFQRLHRPEDFEGTGVGLAIIQRIIHKHGGRVWAEAELNQGATFYFTLAP